MSSSAIRQINLVYQNRSEAYTYLGYLQDRLFLPPQCRQWLYKEETYSFLVADGSLFHTSDVLERLSDVIDVVIFTIHGWEIWGNYSTMFDWIHVIGNYKIINEVLPELSPVVGDSV